MVLMTSSKITNKVNNIQLFKQNHKRSKKEAGIKKSSYMHKPRKERQEKLDSKHLKSCHLWKIKRSKARNYKEFVVENNLDIDLKQVITLSPNINLDDLDDLYDAYKLYDDYYEEYDKRDRYDLFPY